MQARGVPGAHGDTTAWTPPTAPGRSLRAAGDGLLSALTPGDVGARYDRRAALYDALVGTRAYNRFAWGTSPDAYSAFAREALTDGEGSYLDAGCGTLVFTAAAYGAARRPMVLVDRSLDMLARARGRLGAGRMSLVQADLLDLPFPPAGFETVACFGVLHVLADPSVALRVLAAQAQPGGRVFASMLVTDRPVGRAYLRALARQGEIGTLGSAADLEQAAREQIGPAVEVTRDGSMAWLRARLPA